MIIFMAYYTLEQYELLLKYANDRKKLNDHWQDWLVQYIKAKSGLVNDFEVEDFHIDVEKMQAYFKKNGLKNVSANRAIYVRKQGMISHKK